MNRKCYTIRKLKGEWMVAVEAFTFSKLLSKTPGGPAEYVLARPEVNPKYWVPLPINEVYFEVEMPSQI